MTLQSAVLIVRTSAAAVTMEYSARHHKWTIVAVVDTSDDSGEFQNWSHTASQRLMGMTIRLRPSR